MNDTEELVDAGSEAVFSIAQLGSSISAPVIKSVEVTRQYAERFRDLAEFVGDRPLDTRHARFLSRQMEGNTFRWELVSLAVAACEETGGRIYRINGNHTIEARLLCNLPDNARCPAKLLTYTCKTLQDVRQLYSTFDRGKVRSNRDVAVSYLYNTAGFQPYRKGIIVLLTQGLSVFLWPAEGVRTLHAKDEVAYLVQTSYRDAAIGIGDVLNVNAKKAKHLLRAPVIGAMYATFLRDPEAAADFWRKVRDGDNLPGQNDSRLLLRNLLLTSSIESGRGEARCLHREEAYRLCVDAWNIQRKGSRRARLVGKMDGDRPEAV